MPKSEYDEQGQQCTWPDATPPKFLMVVRSTEETKVVLFARSDNQMIVGGVQDERAQFGEDVTKVFSRAFLTHDAAVAWAKQQCREYAGREDVDFVEQVEEKKILLPRAPMMMPRGRM